MAAINFYFEYRNAQKVQLPVNPEKLVVEAPGKNSTVSIVSLGDVNLLKIPGLKGISFESFIPVVNSGSYVQANATVYAPKFYQDFFEAVQSQREPINFVVSGLNVSLKMAVEDFEYWWEGSDPDMHYKLTLKEYRDFSTGIVQLSVPTVAKPVPIVAPTAPRKNTPKKVTVGSKVRVNGRLHRDSYGSGPGATEKNAIRLVNFIASGRSHPYHVTTLDGGWRGWVTASSVEVIE